MTLLKVLKYPHPGLRETAAIVESFDAALATQVDSMFETMYSEQGIGLAATQVHYLYRVLVIDLSAEQNTPLCLINPKIISRVGEHSLQEGCLSIPGVYANISRSDSIELAYQDLAGENQTLSAEGLLSVCIQHEIDHLNGILFFDHLSALKRERLLQKYQKLHRRTY
jgi:peptide deformylase